MEWSMDDALQLIEQYRVHPELWNRAYPKYKDKLCRFRAWSNIAEAFGCSKAEVERKMNVLLTQYRREKHKLLMKLYEGITPGPSKWYAFKRFEFLEGGGDAALSMGVGRRKSRDIKYFNTMGLGLPLLIANSQSLTGWNGGGPFSPSNDRKGLCPMPIAFPNVQNTSDLLNSRNNPFNQNHKTDNNTTTTTETIEIDEKDDEQQNQTTSSSHNDTPVAATAAGGANNFSTHQENDDLEIKQELSDFSHHPPLGRSDSHRSYNSSPDDNRTENDEFAQDLRVSAAAAAQGLDFSRYNLARGLLQQSERYDANCSPPLTRKQQNNQMHANAQQHSLLMATSGHNNEQDDCDYVGSNVSIKLRSMERTQRIIAEKLISEVLFYGQIAELEKTAKIEPK